MGSPEGVLEGTQRGGTVGAVGGEGAGASEGKEGRGQEGWRPGNILEKVSLQVGGDVGQSYTGGPGAKWKRSVLVEQSGKMGC